MANRLVQWPRAADALGRCRTLAAFWTALAVGALLMLGVLPTAANAQTPAGTEIRAAAEARYETPNGIEHRAFSDTLVLVVGQVAGVDLEPPQSVVGNPGGSVLFEHTLVNIGNGTDSLSVTARSQRNWPIQLFFVARGGAETVGPHAVDAGPVTLAQGESIGLLVAVSVPSWETIAGPADTITVTARSLFDPTVSDVLQNLVAIRDPGIAVTLDKRVDRATATIGDVLTYTIVYQASGPNQGTRLTITDVIPDGTSYVPGTLLWNGTPLTDASGDDQGVFDAADNRVIVRIGTIEGGDSGSVTFQVRVEG